MNPRLCMYNWLAGVRSHSRGRICRHRASTADYCVCILTRISICEHSWYTSLWMRASLVYATLWCMCDTLSCVYDTLIYTYAWYTLLCRIPSLAYATLFCMYAHACVSRCRHTAAYEWRTSMTHVNDACQWCMSTIDSLEPRSAHVYADKLPLITHSRVYLWLFCAW